MLNRTWHETHRMPERATRAQRITWHVAHAKACGCREVPLSVRAEVVARLGRKARLGRLTRRKTAMAKMARTAVKNEG